MKQYKLGGGSTATVSLGGLNFVSGIVRVSDQTAELVEAYHVRYLGVLRDTAGEAGGGWPTSPTATETSTLACESRLGDLLNMTPAALVAAGAALGLVASTRMRLIAAILHDEYPGIYELPRDIADSDEIATTAALDGSLSITTAPVGAASGVALGTQPVVKMLRPNGLVDADYVGTITAALKTGTGVLSGTATVTCVAGVATFTNLVVTGAGTKTLGFTTAGGGNEVVSGNVVIS